MEKNVIKPTAIPAVNNAAVKAPSAGQAVEKELKAAAKTTEKICGEINKKILTHKSVSLPEIAQVNGLNKNDIIKLVEQLDAMGSATYSTACALRELHNRMK